MYDRMAGFFYKPPFCERMLEGKKKKKNCFKTTRQTGMEMQMRETEIPKIKNQEDA